MGSEIIKRIDQMILFDYIVNNTDRHMKNFGFIESKDGKLRMAPLFDHGFSLTSRISEEDLEECGMDALTHEPGQPFGSLVSSLGLISNSSLRGLNRNVKLSDLHGLIDKYDGIFSKTRISIMKSTLERGYHYVQKVLSKV